MTKLYDYIMTPQEGDPLNECLDCQYEGREWGEKDIGEDHAEVVCPKCGSIHYYFKDEENA